MAKGRSAYGFNIKDAKQAESIIQTWLKDNKFNPIDLKGESVYLSKSFWSGRKYFTYKIKDDTIKLYAWTHGVAGDFDLDTATNQGVAKAFRQMLAALFHELKTIEK